MATHSSTLAWKIPWTEEPGRLQSALHWIANTQTRLSNFTFTFHWIITQVIIIGEMMEGRGLLELCAFRSIYMYIYIYIFFFFSVSLLNFCKDSVNLSVKVSLKLNLLILRIILFIYLWLCWVFIAVWVFLLVALSRELLSYCIVQASLVSEHRLQALRLQQLPSGIWNLPWSGMEPMSPALTGGFFTTEPPGKPLKINLLI